MKFPPPKPRLFSNDGKWEIIPLARHYSMEDMEPKNEAERARRERLGPLVVVKYTPAMYEIAVSDVNDRIKAGEVQPKRVLFRPQWDAMWSSIRKGQYTVRPLKVVPMATVAEVTQDNEKK